MHGIDIIGGHSITSSSAGSGLNALPGQSGASLQFASLTNASGQPAARGVSPAASAPLGSQSVSTLLQTQELSQTQARGGGHGGGGHHGVKMTPSPEAEEAAESEETRTLRPRQKLTRTVKSSEAAETAEVDENGAVTAEVEQTKENKG